MDANTRTPLLRDREMIYTVDERDGEESSRVSTADSQLTALAEELGMKADALSGASSERDKDGTSSRRRNGPTEAVVTITREQLEELQTALETTSDLIRQVGMNSVEFDALNRRRRHYKIPKCITRNLLLLTVFWQVLNIAAVSVAEAFESPSSKDKQDERSIFLASVVVIVVFQALNLILVAFTTIKLTKQIMHQSVTKSFLGQSFLSTTLLYAGLYTLVYKIEKAAFDNVSGDNAALKTPLMFFKMVFFSISTGTLCGLASVVPVMWPAQLIASTQMLLSYVYFASVLYMAVQPHKSDLKWRVISRSSNGTQGNYRSINPQRVV